MKIRDALMKIRELKPSQYSDAVLTDWLSELDGQVWEDLLCHYQSAHAPAPGPYRLDRDMERELAVRHPHEDLYMTYLGAKIDYQNGEYERYNNGMVMYNAQLQAYYDAYTREHMARCDAYIRI